MIKSLVSTLGLGLTLGGMAAAQDAAPPVAPAPPASTTHVDVYRNNAAHTGYIAENLPTPLSLVWRRTIGFIKDNPSSPTFSDGTVYFAGGKNIYAVNAIDGTVKWQYPATGEAGGNFISTPALADGFLFIGGDNGQFYKLDAKTGKQIWVQKVGGSVRSAPVVDGTTVYFGCSDSRCYALNVETGAPVWTFVAEGPITTSPTLSANQLTFASADNSVYAVNAATGKKLWSVRMTSDPSVSPPVYADNSLFVGSGQALYALNARGGSVKWNRRLSSEVSSPPTVGSSMVYVATQDARVAAFTTRGVPRWTAKVDNPCYAAPLLAGKILLVPTQHGALYAFDAETGALRWQYVVQAAATEKQPKYQYTDISSAPVFVDKSLYVLSDDGSLSAFRADSVDAISPQISQMTPTPGSTVPGARVFYGAVLIDEGSGINPATVSLSVDGAVVRAARYDPSANAVIIDVNTPGFTTLPSLSDGQHLALVKATDWRGNTLTQSWGFTVDNRFNPAGSAAPTTESTPSNNAPAATPANPPAAAGSQNQRRGRRRGGGNGNGNNPGAPPPPPGPLR